MDNAPSAEIKGAEMQMLWAVTDNFRVSAAAAYYNAELTSDYFEINADGVARSHGAGWHAAADHARVQGQSDRAL